MPMDRSRVSERRNETTKKKEKKKLWYFNRNNYEWKGVKVNKSLLITINTGCIGISVLWNKNSKEKCYCLSISQEIPIMASNSIVPVLILCMGVVVLLRITWHAAMLNENFPKIIFFLSRIFAPTWTIKTHSINFNFMNGNFGNKSASNICWN